MIKSRREKNTGRWHGEAIRISQLMKFALLVTAPVMSYSLAGAAAADPSAMSQTQVGAEQDKGFVVKASQAGHQEIADAKMAQQRSARADVKQVASMVEKDHREADRQLASIVKKYGWNIPESAAMQHAMPAPGDYSDAAYLSQQVSAHEDAIALFKKEAADGLNPDLKAFAAEVLPKLQHHLSALQSLQKT